MSWLIVLFPFPPDFPIFYQYSTKRILNLENRPRPEIQGDIHLFNLFKHHQNLYIAHIGIQSIPHLFAATKITIEQIKIS